MSQIEETEKKKLACTLPGQGRNTAASCRGHLVFKVRLLVAGAREVRREWPEPTVVRSGTQEGVVA